MQVLVSAFEAASYCDRMKLTPRSADDSDEADMDMDEDMDMDIDSDDDAPKKGNENPYPLEGKYKNDEDREW